MTGDQRPALVRLASFRGTIKDTMDAEPFDSDNVSLRTDHPWPRSMRVRVEADAGGVTIHGPEGRVVPRSEIRNAFLFPPGPRRPAVVRLLLRSRSSFIELEVADETTGRDLLRALELDVSQTVATFRLPSLAVANPRWIAGCVIASLVVVLVLFPALLFFNLFPRVVDMGVVFALLFVVALPFAQPSVLTVGVDGLYLRWLRQKRFISYDDISMVQTYDEKSAFARLGKMSGLLVTLQSDETLRIAVDAQWDPSAAGNHVMIEERIREAMETTGPNDHFHTASLLRQEGRSVGDWITALRALGSGANVTHRIAPVTSEALWGVIEDPTNAPRDRAAAAIALRGELGEDGRARLTAAARSTAGPKLRVALEAAADDTEEAELARALLEIEP